MRRALNRLAIFAVLGVPEVWLYDGRSLRVRLLGPDGRYTDNPRSQAFPFLPLAEVTRFLSLRTTMSESDLLRGFRDWVRTQIAADWK
jgi:hypothetical protein